MQFHWLNKQNNDELIIFFTGWSFDYRPFEFLQSKNADVIIFYDYNFIDDFKIFENHYRKKHLVAWSMGVYTAYMLKEKLPEFETKLAINGTVFPVDNEFGIPEKPFILTLKHAKTGLEGKFYQNIFNNSEELEKYNTNPILRSMDNRVEELKNLYTRIQNTQKEYRKFYDKAIISSNDKIIPTQNQINFWTKYDTPYEIIESGHFPYYNFNDWKEIICK